jgi:chromosome segregation ATPase
MKAHDAQVDKKLAAIQQQTGELSKNVSSHQTRTNDNILYLTQGLNVLGLFQKSMEGQLVKAADQAKATVQQVEQKLAPVNAQLESLADFQTRTEGNILYHTKQMAGLNELQRNAETKLAQVVDQAKAAVQQVAQKIDGQLKAFSDNVATQQARANENIIFHAQKITSIENGQKDQAALVSKNLGDIKQQVTNLKKEMDTQLINMNKSLKESTEAQLTSLKKETDTQLTSMNKTLKEATDTRIAEVNKSVEAFKESAKTQLTEVNDKVGTLSREVNDLKDGTESRFGKVEAVVNASNEQIADVKTDLEEKANEVDKSLQLVTQEVNGLKDFSAGVRSQLSNIEEDLNAATQRIRNIAREAEESAKSRLADMEKDLDSLNRKVSDITGFQDSVKTRVAEIGRDLTALTQRVDLTSSAGAKSELNALLAKATENLNALDRQMGRFEEFNEMAKSYFDRVNTNLAGLTQQVATFAEFKDNTKSHLARVDESLGRVNQQMAGFSEFKETARARLSEVDGRLNNLILSYERSIIERAPVAAPPKQ